MFFLFSTPELIRNLWQLKTAVFLHLCLLCALPFSISLAQNDSRFVALVRLTAHRHETLMMRRVFDHCASSLAKNGCGLILRCHCHPNLFVWIFRDFIEGSRMDIIHRDLIGIEQSLGTFSENYSNRAVHFRRICYLKPGNSY
jgi:hypothetical protein